MEISKCFLNNKLRIHKAWLKNRGICEIFYKGVTVFKDDECTNLHPNTTFTWNITPSVLASYTELSPCPQAGSTYSCGLQSYTKQVGTATPESYSNGRLKTTDPTVATIEATSTGDNLTILQNTTGVGRWVKIRGEASNNEGTLGDFVTIYQTGDPDNNILIYDENIGDNTLSNLKASDISLASNGTYTVSNGSNASNEKYFYIYAYNQRNIDFNLLNRGSLTLIKTLTTYADDEVVDMNDLKNIISNTKDISTSTDYATYIEITDSSYSISLPAKTLLYVKYTGGTGFEFSPVTYNENTGGGGGSTPSEPIYSNVAINTTTNGVVNIVPDSSCNGMLDDYQYGNDDDAFTYVISTEEGYGYDSDNSPIIFKIDINNNNKDVDIYFDVDYTSDDEKLYTGYAINAIEAEHNNKGDEQFSIRLTSSNKTLFVKFVPDLNASYAAPDHFKVSITAKKEN